MNKGYYELEDVMRVLKKSRSTIIREANAGKIPSEGEKRNRKYPKEAIDALAAVQKKREKSNQPTLIFSPSSPGDLWQEVSIGRELYGDDDIVPYQTLLEWNEVNDNICMSLKYQNKVVGYSSLMPINEDVIISLINDKIRERDTSVYVCSVTVKPTDNPTRDSERAGIIIKNTIKWALSLDRQLKIKNWYGIGATEKGQHLFESLGFQEIVSLYNGERKGYYIDSITKPVSLVNRILERLTTVPTVSLQRVKPGDINNPLLCPTRICNERNQDTSTSKS